MRPTSLFLLSAILCFLSLTPIAHGAGLKLGFYKKSCPSAEKIIQNIVWKNTKAKPSLPAKLLRLFFTDCFVRGCDASILLNSTVQDAAEKDAEPNRTVGGYEVIEAAKVEVEKVCPGVVSCADVTALAARDSVSFQLKRKAWEVQTGRRDGFFSSASDTVGNIPGPDQNFSSLLQLFRRKNLSLKDLVVLSGAHTIGVAHCSTIYKRLYNFTGNGDTDPSFDPEYAVILKDQCPPGDLVKTVEMDDGSSLEFDSSYYGWLPTGRAIFSSDVALLTDSRARKFVSKLAATSEFLIEFGQSMKKMGAIGVLTGSVGEIRKVCNVVNTDIIP